MLLHFSIIDYLAPHYGFGANDQGGVGFGLWMLIDGDYWMVIGGLEDSCVLIYSLLILGKE